ncbi:hypothetical protein HHI36_008808 [Cryptolaemus montrouzieri]|uniref:Uncharacterized protein n=1 Tax=Cryptolaemus montrouzieri TaxID=559131 RepID=A0ABD2MTG8_9CUCU
MVAGKCTPDRELLAMELNKPLKKSLTDIILTKTVTNEVLKTYLKNLFTSSLNENMFADASSGPIEVYDMQLRCLNSEIKSSKSLNSHLELRINDQENSYESKVLDVVFPDHQGQMVRVKVPSGKDRSIVSDKRRPLTQGGEHLKKERNAVRISWKLVNSFRNNSESFQNSELDVDAFLIYFDSVPEAVATSISNELMEDHINLMEQLTEEKPYFSFREVSSIIERDVIRFLKNSRSKDAYGIPVIL